MQIKIYPYNQLFLWSSVIIILGLAMSCAEPRAPEGGPKDKQPPRLHTKKYSTPNPSTNFSDNQIILTFDEWVKLQSAYNQVIISPPLEGKPNISIRNKSVVVKWDETLKDSTTYIINFGEAVQDITEGNIVPNLKMVFSTGAYLDSLNCSGQIVDAETREPKAEVLVMLYRNLVDSIPKTSKPYYFTKTDQQGGFKIDYIKKGRYRIFALDDKNRDYKYNLNNESIAFLDSSFVINDSIQPVLRLRMFKEREATRVFSGRLKKYGTLKVKLNNAVQTANDIRLLDAPEDLKMLVQQGGDSLELWFDGTLDTVGKWRFVITNETENLKDTIQVSAKSRKSYEKNLETLRWFSKDEANSKKGKTSTAAAALLQDTLPVPQHPYESIKLQFNRPIETWDSTQFLFFKDTSVNVIQVRTVERVDSATEEVSIDTIREEITKDTFLLIEMPLINKLKIMLELSAKWKTSARYKLMILPNGLTDFWGFRNKDTLSRIYAINKEDDYGDLTAIIKGADSTKQYIVQLVNAQKRVTKEAIFRDSSQITIVYPKIETGGYTIRVVHDELMNKRWDVGSYDEKRQAEKTTNSKQINLNPGWENMMEMDLKPIEMDKAKKQQIGDNVSDEPNEDG